MICPFDSLFPVYTLAIQTPKHPQECLCIRRQDGLDPAGTAVQSALINVFRADMRGY